MESKKIRLTSKTRILPGPSVYLEINDAGGLAIGNNGPGLAWPHLFTADPDNKYLVPLQQDDRGLYYLEHWTACLAFCHGKTSPVKKVLMDGGALLPWLPLPKTSTQPLIYGLMQAIARSPATRDTKADPLVPYDLSQMKTGAMKQSFLCRLLPHLLGDDHRREAILASSWNERNLLEHALRLRLFDVAETLLGLGMGFSENNLKAGFTIKDLASPDVAADLDVGLFCASKNLNTPGGRKDLSEDDTPGYTYCEKLELWADRFMESGGNWPSDTRSYTYIQNDVQGRMEGDLLFVATVLDPNTFVVDGQPVESWSPKVRLKWKEVWGQLTLRYAEPEIINGDVAQTSSGHTFKKSLSAWLRENGQSEMAAQLEKKAMVAATPEAGSGSMAHASRRF